MVTLGESDKPAKPPPARAGSGMTTEAMLAELETWHATSGLDGVLSPDCHDPDPTISRALVDARHTFLEMCQVMGYTACFGVSILGRGRGLDGGDIIRMNTTENLLPLSRLFYTCLDYVSSCGCLFHLLRC